MSDNSAAELEIEVAYMPKELPSELLSGKPVLIVDVYLSDETDLLSKLRLRQKDTVYEFTKKVNLDPDDLSIQQEYNTPLTKAEFEKLRSAGGREVVKDRYKVPLGEHTMEIDVFREKLEGLVIIEVEFKNQEAKEAFVAPDHFGNDITQENFIAGAYLAGKSLADIQSDIDRVKA